MIGKFIFFGLLIASPLAITGLKCWNQQNGETRHICVFEQTLGPVFKMIGKFIFFGLLIASPLTITGLKCWNQQNGPGDTPALIECTIGICAITDTAGIGEVKACIPMPKGGFLGCRENAKKGVRVCACITDGCNESWATAGAIREISNMSVTFAVILGFLFH